MLAGKIAFLMDTYSGSLKLFSGALFLFVFQLIADSAVLDHRSSPAKSFFCDLYEDAFGL